MRSHAFITTIHRGGANNLRARTLHGSPQKIAGILMIVAVDDEELFDVSLTLLVHAIANSNYAGAERLAKQSLMVKAHRTGSTSNRIHSAHDQFSAHSLRGCQERNFWGQRQAPRKPPKPANRDGDVTKILA
jgi:hypothetical protein